MLKNTRIHHYMSEEELKKLAQIPSLVTLKLSTSNLCIGNSKLQALAEGIVAARQNGSGIHNIHLRGAFADYTAFEAFMAPFRILHEEGNHTFNILDLSDSKFDSKFEEFKLP